MDSSIDHPRCISCSNPWVPPEGVDPTTHICPSCASSWRAMTPEEKHAAADVVLVRAGEVGYRVSKDAGGALSLGSLLTPARAIAVRTHAGRVLFLDERGREAACAP